MKKNPYLKVVFRLLPWAVLAGFILWHGNMFFEETKVTDTLGLEIEKMRPFFFWLSLGLAVLGFLHGLFRDKIPFLGAKEKRAAKLTTPRRILRVVFVSLLVAGNAILSFHIVELINNPWIAEMANIHILLGCLITLAFFVFFIFITNSVSIGAAVTNILLVFWAIVNYLVLEFRSIPLQWIDLGLGSLRAAMNVSGGYTIHLTWQMVTGIAGAAFASGLFLHLEIFHIFKRWPGKIASRAIAGVTFLLFYIVIFRTNCLADTGIWLRDWQPQYTYKRFGMEAGFLAFAKASFPTAPDVYSEEHLQQIIENSENAETVGKICTEEPEIILCIMNESFSDLSIYPNVATDQPVAPFLDSLTENAQQGPLMVSVIGGTTANSEYEFLTGNSCMLSPQTVVYNSYIKQDQFSLARNLKAQGYAAVAQHPYYPNGWNRQIVYPRMGFDSFLSYKDYVNPSKLRGFITDKSDYDKVIETIEAKKPGEKLFLFNVTMQNHGEYDYKNFTNTVHLQNYTGESRDYMEQYLTLIHISDQALEELVEYLKTREEKILLCFFGDHQPALPDDFVEYAFGKKADTLSFQEEQMKYRTRYLIWANYDIPESQGQLLSASYLGSYLLRMTGLKESGYNQYLNRLHETFPGINAFAYADTHGNVLKHDGNELLEDYKCLIYNELTGGSGRDASFFGLESGG